MEKDKYYTPSIEEFHVGFEYEQFVQDFKILSEPVQKGDEWSYEVNHLQDRWQKVEYELDDFIEIGADGEHEMISIDPNLIRVKFLDKEDIEELGFKFIPTGEILQTGDNYIIDAYEKGFFSSGDNYTILTLYDDNFCHIYSNVNWVGDPSAMSTIFTGKIKNKSELKVLLKQLGIIE